MMASLYIGATGLKGHGEGMNCVTNNLANVNTVGFKQQSLLFSDLMYESQAGMGGWWGAQENSYVAMGQMGKGVQVDSVRTLFTQGAFELGMDVTDLAIGGKGFFQVTTQNGDLRYTRAGNFRFDKDGVLKLPTGESLTGIPLDETGKKGGGVAPVRVDPNKTFPAKGTSSMTLSLNLGITENRSMSPAKATENLLLSLNLGITEDRSTSPPEATTSMKFSLNLGMTNSSESYTEQMQVYDKDGKGHIVTLFVDGMTVASDGTKTMNYVITAPAQPPATVPQELMKGMLTFDSTTMKLNSMTASIPNGTGGWKDAPGQATRVPVFTLNGQSIAMDFNSTTAYTGSSTLEDYLQDGYSGNPYFSMIEAFNATATPPLASGKYGYAQQVPIIDADGYTHIVTVYVDGVPASNSPSGKTIMEFFMVTPDTTPGTSQALMAGTLTFDNATEQLVDMSAFNYYPTDPKPNPKDLSQWTPAPQQNGVPMFYFNGQGVALDFGIQGAWTTTPANAAAVGIYPSNLSTMGTNATLSPNATTTYEAGVVSKGSYVQDGYNGNVTDPYFAMVRAFDAKSTPPLTSDNYSYTQQMRVYDKDGNAQTVTVYMDGTPATTDGKRTMQFLMTAPDVAPGTGTQALMAGTLTFSGAGQLVDMSAFTLSGTDPNDLYQWKPALQQNGVPTFSLNGASVALDFGIQGAWTKTAPTAGHVGKDPSNLSSMGTTATRSPSATTAYAGTSSQKSYIQDGYTTGYMTTLDIRPDGTVIASYSNGRSQPLYEIPICRFTSEDGLHREGYNLFSATPEAGQMEMGRAGTENYGQLVVNALETSNVDMAREMVNMIVIQRGFQYNSKVISTADAMLQKALELKRM